MSQEMILIVFVASFLMMAGGFLVLGVKTVIYLFSKKKHYEDENDGQGYFSKVRTPLIVTAVSILLFGYSIFGEGQESDGQSYSGQSDEIIEYTVTKNIDSSDMCYMDVSSETFNLDALASKIYSDYSYDSNYDCNSLFVRAAYGVSLDKRKLIKFSFSERGMKQTGMNETGYEY